MHENPHQAAPCFLPSGFALARPHHGRSSPELREPRLRVLRRPSSSSRKLPAAREDAAQHVVMIPRSRRQLRFSCRHSRAAGRGHGPAAAAPFRGWSSAACCRRSSLGRRARLRRSGCRDAVQPIALSTGRSRIAARATGRRAAALISAQRVEVLRQRPAGSPACEIAVVKMPRDVSARFSPRPGLLRPDPVVRHLQPGPPQRARQRRGARFRQAEIDDPQPAHASQAPARAAARSSAAAGRQRLAAAPRIAR